MTILEKLKKIRIGPRLLKAIIVVAVCSGLGYWLDSLLTFGGVIISGALVAVVYELLDINTKSTDGSEDTPG